LQAHQTVNSAVPGSNLAPLSGINPEAGRTTEQKQKNVSGAKGGAPCQLDNQKNNKKIDNRVPQ